MWDEKKWTVTVVEEVVGVNLAKELAEWQKGMDGLIKGGIPYDALSLSLGDTRKTIFTDEEYDNALQERGVNIF